MTKKLISLVLCLLMVVSIAGCAGTKKDDTNDKGNDTTTDDQQKDTGKKSDPITILCADDTIEGGALQFVADLYEEETGIPVEVVEVPYEDMRTKLQNMIRAGNPPALVRGTSYSEFMDHVLDFSDVIDVETLARKNGVTEDGKIIAVPSNVTANGLLYNKTLFEQAGVEVPQNPDEIWTWNEFVEKLNTVVDNSDAEYGMVWDHSQHRYSTLLYQFGGSILNEDATATRIANDKSLEALNFFVSLFDEKIMPKSTWIGTEDTSAMFKTGKVAAHFSGNWKIPEYQKDITDFDWGVAYMPYEETRSSVLGGNFIFGINGTGVEQETKDFVKWFWSDDTYKQYCEKGQYLPGKLGVNPTYSTDAYDVFVNELNNTPDIANHDWMDHFPGLSYGNALRDNIDLVLNGDLTPEEALVETEKAIMDAYGIASER